jgi:PAS domain S-box-containing protein
MQDYKRIIALILIMMSVALIIGASSIYMIYRGGVERERLRLQDIVRSQARLLEAIASFDRTYSTYPGGAEAGTLAQFVEGHRKFERRSLGETGELTAARRDGDTIVFLLRHNGTVIESATGLSMQSGFAEPMRAALSGQSGTMIGKDYAGREVLAAYEPVNGLNLGLVAKVELAEIRRRFAQVSGGLALISLLTVAAASALFFAISEPMVRRFRHNATRFRELFQNMSGGAAVFRAVGDGEDFLVTDFNRKGGQIACIEPNSVIGTRVTQTFPGIAACGLLDVFKDVWRTGQARSLPSLFYRDERIQGWRDNYVYKLPTGELVALFDDISERKRAEDALRESEARFRGTFENAAVGIAHIGMDGAWLRVNQRLCEIVGYSRDELLTKTFQDITHPDDLDADLDQFALLKHGEITSYGMDKRYIRKHGDVVWIGLTVALQRDDAGTPLYCISIVEDISARRRAEQVLQESEARMRALLDASQDEILLLSTDGTVRAINKAAERRLAGRLATTNAIGRHLSEILPAGRADARLAIVRQVAETTRLVHVDWQIGTRWFEFWFYPVQRASEPVSEVAVYAREITRRKNAENEFRRLYQAIQQSPASVVITDPKGDIVYVNPKFSEVTGYSHDEVIGKNPRVLKSGEVTSGDYDKLWSTILSGQTWKGEFHNRKKDGSLFWELASIAPVKDAKGEIINFVAVKEDITERRAVEEQLRQSQKMQAIGQLTGGIAHDFNNLLTIIVGNLELLDENAGTDAHQHRFIADALWAAQRGSELTHRLLAFARLQPLRPTVVNLTDIVRGLTDLLRRTLGSAIEVEEDFAAETASVKVDVGELERAIVNLAINARDAMPNGGTLTLQTRNAVLDDDYAEQHPEVTAGKYVMLAVSDTGTGMPPEVLKRIFEPFFTTKKAGQGSGLGLSMVYGFTKQSGGHIAVYSEVGRCTTFKLFFPQTNAAGAILPAPGADITGFSVRGKVALVVEDEERLRKVAATILLDAGFSVLEAGTGAEAIRQAERPTLDLLFTDVELPGGMNGLEVAERIRKRHRQVKVLYTTGYSASLRTASGPLPKGSSLLAKPYARQELIRQLRALFPEGAR